ncbi:MAG: hypothetical protein M3321_03555, partial [Actinomycetota bacterium]|nr:hypothetical protein [Actinomycetota bacterium]
MRRALPFLVAAFAAFAAAPADAAPAPVAWCGTDTAATDRKPDAVASRQIGVIYAFPAGGADRFAALASPIVTDLTVADAWWRREDPARTLRFDLAGFPACSSTLGGLDLARVPLQRGAGVYAPLRGRFDQIASDLFGAPFAFASRFKKYLVYYDGPVEEPDVCGTAAGRADTGPSFAVVYIRACGADPVGQGALWADVAVHELLHALGAVPQAAPHTCARSAGHVCDSDVDLMFPSTSGEALDAMRLDVGRDDYYGHGGSWFDVQDSGWLARLDAALHPLTVAIEGTGRVDSDLPGIECPPACSIPWESGTLVTLTAIPGPGARFVGWRGACTGRGVCALAVSAGLTVTAAFGRASFRATVRTSGPGRVTSRPAGISCGPRC